MDTKSSTKGTDPLTDASQLGSELTAGLTSVDGAAAERVQNLQWVHQARESQLSRTAASLKAKYGADDAGVKAAEAAAAAANVTALRVAMLHRQMTTADPQVASKGWVLHGRVYNFARQPVSGFTVFLVDAAKTYQQAYGFTYTDDTGYFLLQYAGPDPASQDKSQSARQTPATALFIEVANKKALPVYVASFEPVEGMSFYQDVILPEGDQPIGDPPREIRDIALPQKKKKRQAD